MIHSFYFGQTSRKSVFDNLIAGFSGVFARQGYVEFGIVQGKARLAPPAGQLCLAGDARMYGLLAFRVPGVV